MPSDRKNIASDMDTIACSGEPAIVAATVNSPDSSRPMIEGSLRLATRAMPRACSRSVSQPPPHAPRIEQNNGIDARKPVLAMLMCCCISRSAGNQVWYIQTA